MATTTQHQGIERSRSDKLGVVDRYREKWPWFDHIMAMVERYNNNGGTQLAAGITYFSVLSMFPILMLAFAVAATVLAGRPEVIDQINTYVTNLFEGELASTINEIIDAAIAQRGALYDVGGLTALWSGTGWMSNLRFGVSNMWNYADNTSNFVVTKLRDLLGLLLMLPLLFLAVGITAVGSSSITERIIRALNLDGVPGISTLVFALALLAGLVANFLVFLWMMRFLPRGEVPMRAAVKAALIGAVLFEVFKQVGSLFFGTAVTNPAGATFGPIIGVMLLFYIVWQIVLYCAAWAATTKEALAIAPVEVPGPAVINVRVVAPAPSLGSGVKNLVSKTWKSVRR